MDKRLVIILLSILIGACQPQNREINAIPEAEEQNDLNDYKHPITETISRTEYVVSEYVYVPQDYNQVNFGALESCAEWIKRKQAFGYDQVMTYTKVPIDFDVSQFSQTDIYLGSDVASSFDGTTWEVKRHCPYLVIDKEVRCVLAHENYKAVYTIPVSSCDSEKFGEIKLAKENYTVLKVVEKRYGDNVVPGETEHIESDTIYTLSTGNTSESCYDWLKRDNLFGDYEKNIYTKVSSGYNVDIFRTSEAYDGTPILTSLNDLYWEIKDHCPYLSESQCYLKPQNFVAPNMKPVSNCVSNSYGKIELAKERHRVFRTIEEYEVD